MRLVRDGMTSFALGVNDSTAPDEYRAQEVTKLINGRVDIQGNSIRRRNGQLSPHDQSIGGASGNVVYGATEFVTASGTRQLVAFVGQKMFTSEDEGATWTEQVSSLVGDYWSLVTIREGSSNVLCCANGGTNAYQWDGTTWSTISGIPNGVKYLEVFGERLVASGHSGIDVVASKVGDIDTWTIPDGWTVKAGTHDGDTEVTGLFTLGSVLLVFKRKSVGYTEGYGYETLQVATGARGISRSVGCVAPRSIAAVGDQGVMWLSERGFELYQAGGQVVLVSGRMQGFVDSILWDQVEDNPMLPTALWWQRAREYWCAVPVGVGYASSSFQETNSHIFVFRPGTDEGPPAMWANNWAQSGSLGDALTAEVDENGRLCFVEGRTGRQLTTPGGRLALTEGNEYGVDAHFLSGTAGRLTLNTGANATANVLFTANVNGRVGAPVLGAPVARIYWMEEGDVDGATAGGASTSPIRMPIRIRPLLFGDQFRTKRLRRVRIQTSQKAEASVEVTPYANGVPGTLRTLTMPVTSLDRPVEKKLRVSGRGEIHDIEVYTEDDVTIVGVEAIASVEDDAL